LIRQATHDDVARMLDVGEELHQHSSFASMTWNREKAEAMVRSLIDNDQFCIAYVRDEKIVGFMGGYVTQTWYSDDFIACDLSLFVLPEYRGGMAAVRMIEAFTTWSLGRAVKQIRPGVSTGEVGETAERLYERLGYQRVGSVFMLEK
jgi:GNAT superfamily N-acetyltransferase